MLSAFRVCAIMAYLMRGEEVRVMIRRDTFNDLIKGLEPFDRKMAHALDTLKRRRHTRTVQTSRFELCHLLGVPYDSRQVVSIDESLKRLAATPLYLPGPQSGFSLTTRAVSTVRQEPESEKLTIVLGKLYRL
jgi:hypothetical protein